MTAARLLHGGSRQVMAEGPSLKRLLLASGSTGRKVGDAGWKC